MSSRTIVAGVDGSEGSAGAVAWCAATAPLLDAEVVAVFVIEPLVAFVPPTTPVPVVDEHEHERMRKALEEEWCAPLHDAGVPFRTEVLDGTPADALIGIAEQLDADLVVVGRRGHGGLSELLLGSAARALAHRCPRPVVIVPATG